MKAQLEDIRLRCEEFFQEMQRVKYHKGSGQSPATRTSMVYDGYPDLGSPALVDLLRSETESLQSLPAGSESFQRHKLLLLHTLQIYVGYQTREVADRVESVESRGVIRVGKRGEVIPFVESERRLRNEPVRTARETMANARDRFVAAEVVPVRESLWKQSWRALDELGVQDCARVLETLGDVDLVTLHSRVEEFLKRTRDTYLDLLRWLARKKIDLPPEQLRYHDLAFLVRAQEYDRHFPADEMVPKILRSVSKMNLDPLVSGAIQIDQGLRVGKIPGAFCAPVRIPEEIYLVADPTEGAESYYEFLRELGRALHFGYTSPSALWEYKRLGDRSVSEAYAVLFGGLASDRIWLRKILGWVPTEEYRKARCLSELAALRRTCISFAVGLLLHRNRNLRGTAAEYGALSTETMAVEYSPADYLEGVDLFLSAADTLRGWMVKSALSQYLRENFDEDWFVNPRTGQFFTEFWHEGRKLGAEQFVRQLAYPTMTFDFLIDTIQSALS